MQLDRTKNSLKGTFWGVISKIVSLLIPFVERTVLIYTLGIQYLGLSSLFTSILQVLSLAELGFSSAIVFSLYKPIAENDTETICALMNFYRKVYRIIGGIIGVIGLAITPFLKYLIKSDIPEDINVYILYLIYLSNTVISYFLFAYKACILNAYQRVDVTSKILIIVNLAMYTAKIATLLLFKNYYIYVICIPLGTIANNIVTSVVVDRNYKQYKPYGTISKELRQDIKTRINGLVVQKVGQASRNSLDSIIISTLLGLTAVGIYNNYYTILTAVTGLMSAFTTSLAAGVGNSIAMDSVEKNYEDFKKLQFIYMWVVNICATCLFCMYQPFMILWMGKDNLLPLQDVVLFTLYYFLLAQGDINSTYYNAAGLWNYGKFRYLIEAALNLLLNIILGKLFGVTGIILATILTILLFTYWYGSGLVFKYYFKNGRYKFFLLTNIGYLAVTAFSCAISYFICNLFVKNERGSKGLLELLLCAIISVIVPNVLNLMIYRWTPTFKNTKAWIISKKNILKK